MPWRNGRSFQNKAAMTQTAPEVIEVKLSWEEDIALLTICNLARRNALSDEVNRDLLRHLAELIANPRCRAIVLSGDGGIFCAGGDVKAMARRAAAAEPSFVALRMRFTTLYHPMIRMMVEGPKPIVSAVEGVAYGGGLALACAADYTVAARNTRWCAAQILRGVCPDVALYYLLTARTGPGRARDLLLSGRVFEATDAERWGIAHELTEPGATLATALQVARRFAAVPPLALALTKAAMTHSYQTLEACFRAEQDYQSVVGLSKDHQESVAAFLEKRKPVYTDQ
jgi:enoyl-CoA hydratase/carnithine racemase